MKKLVATAPRVAELIEYNDREVLEDEVKLKFNSLLQNMAQK